MSGISSFETETHGVSITTLPRIHQNSNNYRHLEEKCRNLDAEARFLKDEKKYIQNELFLIKCKTAAVEKENEDLTKQIEDMKQTIADINKRCKQKEISLEKSENNIFQLQDEIIQLKSDNVSYQNDIEKLKNQTTMLKRKNQLIEDKIRQKPSDILLDPRSCRNRQNNINKIFDLKVEVSRLRDGNTIATSLPDPDRPANLGRRFSELFEEEWTVAINELKGDFRKNTNFLRDIVMKSFVFAQHTAQKYLDGLDATILQLNNKVQVKDPNIVKINKAHWLKIANYIALDLHESFASESCSYMQCGTGVRNFIKKVVPLCLKMILHDPPLALTAQEDGVIDPECYEPYNDSTREMTFIIWPALYLHEGGLILCKGVAGGMD